MVHPDPQHSDQPPGEPVHNDCSSPAGDYLSRISHGPPGGRTAGDVELCADPRTRALAPGALRGAIWARGPDTVRPASISGVQSGMRICNDQGPAHRLPRVGGDWERSGPRGKSWIASSLLFYVFLLRDSVQVGIAMISDCLRNDERGTALGVLNMAFILAAPLGAIVGGLAAQSTSWRFIFFAPSIAAGLLVLVGLFVYHESYPPVILSRKKRQFQHDGHLVCKTPYDDRHPTIADLYYKTIIRPVYFLTTQPIIQVLSLYTGYIYGLTYLIFSTFTSLWEQQYHETASIASLHYIAAGIGYFIGIVACILFADRIYRGLKGKNNDIGRPEFRIPMMSVSAILIPTSLFWYGWTAQEHIQWVVPNLAIVLTMCGCTIVFQCTTAYCIEAYPLYAASASAASFLCRGLCAFGFPLFAPSLYARLGYGWGDSILGFVALIISGLVPVVLWKFGVRLRKISSYAI